MASNENDPPDKTSVKYYKHAKVYFVICIICESVFHSHDFEKVKNKKVYGWFFCDQWWIC